MGPDVRRLILNYFLPRILTIAAAKLFILTGAPDPGYVQRHDLDGRAKDPAPADALPIFRGDSECKITFSVSKESHESHSL